MSDNERNPREYRVPVEFHHLPQVRKYTPYSSTVEGEAGANNAAGKTHAGTVDGNTLDLMRTDIDP